MEKKSIWEDTLYTTSAENSPFEYEIALSGDPSTVIFRGKAYAAPAEETISISINKIAQDYLSIALPDLVGLELGSPIVTDHEEACRTFILSSGGAQLETYSFLIDWSYQSKDFSSTITLSDPVDTTVAAGMYTFSTVYSGGTVKTTSRKNLSGACGDYALYYLNRSGGYDFLLLRGLVKTFDGYTRYSINRHYTAGSLDFGKKTYNNQIVTRYECNTGWLNDSQSENFAFNALSSNQVYLHDLRRDEVIPVVLTDAEAEYKNYTNNGRKMVNFKFNIERSQTQQNIS